MFLKCQNAAFHSKTLSLQRIKHFSVSLKQPLNLLFQRLKTQLLYSKTMFQVLNQVFFTEDSKLIHTIITTRLIKLNEIILIRNYLQQRKKHQASFAWVCDRQHLNKQRSMTALILMSGRVSKELSVSSKDLRKSRE